MWCLLWSAALHFQDVLPSRPVPVIRVPNRNVTSYPLNQSHSASRWLIQQCPDSKWMGSTFEACLWRRTCNPSQWVWKNKPRGLHVGDKQHMWDKHNQSWQSLASKISCSFMGQWKSLRSSEQDTDYRKRPTFTTQFSYRLEVRCEIFRSEMFGSRLAATWIWDISSGKWLYKNVLTGHSKGFGFTSSYKYEQIRRVSPSQTGVKVPRSGSGCILGCRRDSFSDTSASSGKTEQHPPRLPKWSAILCHMLTMSMSTFAVVAVVVGDWRDVCSTRPSWLDDAFVRCAKVLKNKSLIQKNQKGLLFCRVIFAFWVKILVQSAVWRLFTCM